MKFILSVALLVAIVGFINAQSPPAAPQACVSYVNSTEAAFCSAYVPYLIQNTTNYAAVNGAAKSTFDTVLAKITEPTDACRTALATYACHSKIPRCARNSVYSRVFQGTCNNVMTACNITFFPANFTSDQACINNQLNSVEGQNAICVPSAQVAVGASCQSIFNNDITTPTTIQNSACPIVSSCNFTATAPVCVRPNNIGDSCTTNAGCISNPLSGGEIGGVGSALTCISGICSYGGKRGAQSCFSNGECLSNNCTAGVCQVSAIGGPCTTSGGCNDNLYCDTRNSTCYSLAQGNEPCGFLQSNWDLVPCLSGFSCVRPNANATSSTCKPVAQIGQACSVGTSVVNDAPTCNPLSAEGPVTCQDGVCALRYKTAGQLCTATSPCDPRFTCSYFNSTTGTCVEPGTVTCANVGAANCNQFQVCNCGTDVAQTGVCAIDTTNPRVRCATQYLALATCQQTQCNNAPFVAYEANTCVTSNCRTQLNSYYCCAKTVVGANFVAPAGMPADPCATPTPTPGPTSPTTGTPVPIQSSKRSGASTVAVNMIALILAVVAFL